ncbi:MAG: hypothetical protein ACC655_08805 [Rhodothermia bacterium]
MNRIPFIHQTDLFRPHEDPDDHFDLATAYSLHLSGHYDLKGILIDYPPPHHDGVPDQPGIEMLNHITGLDVPFAVGQEAPMADHHTGETNNAVQFLVRILEASDTPVVLNLVGSCRDVAIAARRYPDLFRDKCRAIYLGAGTGCPASEAGDEVEYNVRLDVGAFVSLFDAPCPIYWCPCFEKLGVGMRVHEFGTWYTFAQRDILPSIAPQLQSYFAYMFSCDRDPDWKKWLDPERFGPVIEHQRLKLRPMWSTAGMLHAAGLALPDVFSFERAAVSCTSDGHTAWRPDDSSSVRVFRIYDQEDYREKMPAVLRDLMIRLSSALRC